MSAPEYLAARARDRDFSSSAISNRIKHTPPVMDNIYFSELSMEKKGEKSNEKRDCKCHDGSLPVRISCNGMRHGK